MAETIRYLTDRGIPVDEPYRHDAAGGEHDRELQAEGAVPLRMGGVRGRCPLFGHAFAVVLEALAELLAARIKQVSIPTIGIGASAECDGQILVLEDMLGLSPRVQL